MGLRWQIFILMRKQNAWYQTLKMEMQPRRPTRGSWFTATERFISKVSRKRSPIRKIRICNDFSCSFALACSRGSTEGNRDGAKTAYLDRLARGTVRAVRPVCPSHGIIFWVLTADT